MASLDSPMVIAISPMVAGVGGAGACDARSRPEGMPVRPTFETLFPVDRLVHEPSRLAILTVLDACREADFRQLSGATGLPAAYLSSHLSKLKTAGYIEIVKGFRGPRPYTAVGLTVAGEYAVRQHWKCLDDGRKAADVWNAPKNARPADRTPEALPLTLAQPERKE
jgi:DNA-binding transcriptional ArsR family regulator